MQIVCYRSREAVEGAASLLSWTHERRKESLMNRLTHQMTCMSVIFLLAPLLSAITSPLAPHAALAHSKPPVQITARLACAAKGGANITLTIRNTAPRMVRIKEDVHLELDTVRAGEQRPATVSFVFPGPG
jgi:hypothetical protein